MSDPSLDDEKILGGACRGITPLLRSGLGEASLGSGCRQGQEHLRCGFGYSLPLAEGFEGVKGNPFGDFGTRERRDELVSQLGLPFCETVELCTSVLRLSKAKALVILGVVR